MTDTTPRLTPAQLEAFGEELDAIRAARHRRTSASATSTTSAR